MTFNVNHEKKRGIQNNSQVSNMSNWLLTELEKPGREAYLGENHGFYLEHVQFKMQGT